MPRIRTPSRPRLVLAVELADERCDALSDLVADRAHLLDPLAVRVVELPVDVTLPRDVRAPVAAAHRHDDVGPLRLRAVERRGAPARHVDAELAQRLDDLRMEARRRRAPR